MASLVSPGVSVSVQNDSFYIPASAPTVPLFFVATQANKKQPDGITAASGTQESNVVRTVTSIGQSVQLYGIPHFWADQSGNQFHGDCRNEYGLFALNQFLGVGNRAFVLRANLDLTDAATTFLGIGTPIAGTTTLVGVGNGTIGSITAPSAFVLPQTITVVMNTATTFTVTGSKVGIIGTGTVGVAFTSSTVNLTVTAGSTAFNAEDYFQFDLVYTHTTKTGTGNGKLTNLAPDPALAAVAGSAETWTITFSSATAFTVSGSISGSVTTAKINGSTASSPFAIAGTVGSRTATFDNDKINFTVTEGSTPFANADAFTVAVALINKFDPLGSTQSAKRTTVLTALQSLINSNTEVRSSDVYEYNLIVAPGYPEVVDELLALSVSIGDEAFVIGDTPVDKTAEGVSQWSLTSGRFSSSSVAYYYPWALASNLDGVDVVAAPSGVALRTYAYSDNQSYVWFAPAGARRGLVTGVSKVGYVSGTLGTATTFVEVNLNQGQRDNLYEDLKKINPIVFFAGRGLLIWGQKTSATGASALDRVNVSRLVMYLARALRKGAFPFVFEPNDKVTRDNLKAAADGLLNDVMSKRGLYDFATMCNTDNNTPERIDNNEMYLDVAIKPVKAAEFIYIPIRVLSTNATMPG
jgi:phage tail sheath protein FI